MNQVSINYAVVLYQLSVPEDTIQATADLFDQSGQLKQILSSPVTPLREKHRVIDRIFPAPVRAFLKELCDNRDMGFIGEIFQAYHDYSLSQRGILKARLTCVTEPTEEHLSRIGGYLCRKFDKTGVEWAITKDPSLVGGFVIRVGDIEMDRSFKGHLEQLQQKLIWR